MTKYAKIALLTGLLIPGAALAQLNLGDTVGTSEADIRTALEAQGYVVTEVEIEDDEIEAEVTLDGVAYEIDLSPETGEVIAMSVEDDDDESDDD